MRLDLGDLGSNPQALVLSVRLMTLDKSHSL